MGKCDPYVKCRLDGTTMRTRTILNSYECEFHEDFVFEWAGRQMLSVEVWDQDKVSRDEMLGAVDLDMHDGLRRDHVWLNIRDGQGRIVIGRNKAPTRVQLRVAPAPAGGVAQAGAQGREGPSSDLSAQQKKEAARMFASLTGHKWAVGVKARRAGAFNGKSTSSYLVELALIGQDLVRKRLLFCFPAIPR